MHSRLQILLWWYLRLWENLGGSHYFCVLLHRYDQIFWSLCRVPPSPVCIYVQTFVTCRLTALGGLLTTIPARAWSRTWRSATDCSDRKGRTVWTKEIQAKRISLLRLPGTESFWRERRCCSINSSPINWSQTQRSQRWGNQTENFPIFCRASLRNKDLKIRDPRPDPLRPILVKKIPKYPELKIRVPESEIRGGARYPRFPIPTANRNIRLEVWVWKSWPPFKNLQSKSMKRPGCQERSRCSKKRVSSRIVFFCCWTVCLFDKNHNKKSLTLINLCLSLPNPTRVHV